MGTGRFLSGEVRFSEKHNAQRGSENVRKIVGKPWDIDFVPERVYNPGVILAMGAIAVHIICYLKYRHDGHEKSYLLARRVCFGVFAAGLVISMAT